MHDSSQEISVSNSLPDGLLKKMNNIVKVVNYIKSDSLRYRLFVCLICEIMDSDFHYSLLHIELLSNGICDSTIYLFLTEMIGFYDIESSGFEFLNRDNWWLM